VGNSSSTKFYCLHCNSITYKREDAERHAWVQHDIGDPNWEDFETQVQRDVRVKREADRTEREAAARAQVENFELSLLVKEYGENFERIVGVDDFLAACRGKL
jgi:hypothetical protein